MADKETVRIEEQTEVQGTEKRTRKRKRKKGKEEKEEKEEKKDEEENPWMLVKPKKSKPAHRQGYGVYMRSKDLSRKKVEGEVSFEKDRSFIRKNEGSVCFPIFSTKPEHDYQRMFGKTVLTSLEFLEITDFDGRPSYVNGMMPEPFDSTWEFKFVSSVADAKIVDEMFCLCIDARNADRHSVSDEYEAGDVVSYGVVLSPSWYNVRHYSIVAIGEDHKLRTFSYEEHFTPFISLKRKPPTKEEEQIVKLCERIV